MAGAAWEQMALLEVDGIPCAVGPGLRPAFAAGAAAKASFTVPETVQGLAVPWLVGRTPVPPGQSVSEYARHGASLAVYPSARDPDVLQEELVRGGYAGDTPVLMAHKVGWPDQKLAWTTVEGLEQAAREQGFTRQTVFLVLPGERQKEGARSRLYDAGFSHGYRP